MHYTAKKWMHYTAKAAVCWRVKADEYTNRGRLLLFVDFYVIMIIIVVDRLY